MVIIMDEIQDNCHSSGADLTADSDALILVDAADHSVGCLSKIRCHEGRGVLHRAFSLLIFNGNGELLIQQRARSKRLWPLYWSNSCCSHPRSGESLDTATRRRLHEELGLSCPLHFLFKFEYQAQFDATGAEHELCSVFIGRCTDPIRINNQEILSWRWISVERLQAELTAHGAAKFTPWFIIEWARIWRDHREQVLALQAQN
jgi:isopentenyl-diphosphate Delta-isomerase